MIWTDPKVIFIHIPKTGGSSIEQLLYQCHWLLGREGRVGQHSSLQDCYNVVGDLSEFKIFTVVRHPLQRIMSVYLMMYNRNNFSFPETGSKLNGRRYVPFPEFYHEVSTSFMFCEDLYHYLSIDGEIPQNVHLIDFNNLKVEFESYFDSHGFELPSELPHINSNPMASEPLKEYLIQDPEYIATIGRVYDREIEYLSKVGILQ